jgi:hypothetical protein
MSPSGAPRRAGVFLRFRCAPSSGGLHAQVQRLCLHAGLRRTGGLGEDVAAANVGLPQALVLHGREVPHQTRGGSPGQTGLGNGPAAVEELGEPVGQACPSSAGGRQTPQNGGPASLNQTQGMCPTYLHGRSRLPSSIPAMISNRTTAPRQRPATILPGRRTWGDALLDPPVEEGHSVEEELELFLKRRWSLRGGLGSAPKGE